jgi:general secretion pathway protein G
MSKMRRILAGGDKGFTLIELLVVIAVLGILAAIAIPRLGGVTDKARLTEGVSFAGTLRSAQEMYYAENDEYYATGDAETGALASAGLGQYIDSSIPDGWTVDFEQGSTTTYGMLIYNGTDGSTSGDLKVVATPGGVSSEVVE